MTQSMACVILAGGRGKRMGTNDLHKVCFPIADVPAIVRAIDTYKQAGLKKFIVVVGQMAQQVIATVAETHPEVTFVFQSQPRGTGHAALVAAAALKAQNHSGSVMIVMGDKVTTSQVVEDVVTQFKTNNPDILMTTLPKSAETTAGRVVRNKKGKILGVTEKADIEHARKKGTKIRVGSMEFTGAQLEKNSTTVNASMYIFKFSPLCDALDKLSSDNAQGELYLTDTVEQIVETGKAEEFLLQDPTELMAFNTPAELMEIEQIVRLREKPSRVSLAEKKTLSTKRYKSADQWLKLLETNSAKLKKILRNIYGNDKPLIEERRKAMISIVKCFIKKYSSDRKMILCRAPGRVNLMGRHVDHRGGWVNVMAISREIIVAASKREDDIVSLCNLDSKSFPSREFSISDLLRDASWSDWIDFVNSHTVKNVLQSARGDWSHYARSPLLRLQHECRNIRLKGMDCVVGGNIPQGAGLSSSSSLVVAFAQAAVELNSLDISTCDFVDLCGEGEWFVGSRGGAADHAAISTGRLGTVSRIGFHPFLLDGEVPFPENLRVVIAYSGYKAVKSTNARDVFNQRVACYELALRYIKKYWPAASGAEHLRDLIPEKLKIEPAEIYRAIKLLPASCSRAELKRIFNSGEDRDFLKKLFDMHANVGKYDLRGAVIYGISEIIRSYRFSDALDKCDLKTIGRMMRSSHNGDRVVWNKDGKLKPYIVKTDDTILDHLAATEVELVYQCGRYACSTEAIDQMVDIANSIDGVVGAQLAGAGLGGCMMVLTLQETMDEVINRLDSEYYKPRKLPTGAYAVTPVAGAGPLEF